MSITNAILLENGIPLLAEDGTIILKDAISVPTLAQPAKFTDTGFASAASLAAPAFGSPLTPGSKLIAYGAVSLGATTTLSFTDTVGNTWNTLTVHFWANVGYALALAWADNPAGNTAATVTVNFGTAGTLRQIGVSEWLGLATGAPDVSTAGNNSTTDPVADVSMTTTLPNDLVVAAAAGDNPVTGPGAGFTILGGPQTNTGSAFEYMVKAAAGAIAPTIDQAAAGQFEIISAAFKAA